MKINKFFALALIAVLTMATIGFFTTQASAQSPDPTAQVTDCENDDADETDDVEDLDDVEEEVQCGPQDEQEDEAEEVEDEAEGADVPLTGTTLDKASTAALDYLGGGSVTQTEVGDEEGYYEVEVTLDDGSQVDVHLDENFNVLSQVADTD